eukprot:6182344-Pleurochrysis_carterae.AAC.7
MHARDRAPHEEGSERASMRESERAARSGTERHGAIEREGEMERGCGTYKGQERKAKTRGQLKQCNSTSCMAWKNAASEPGWRRRCPQVDQMHLLAVPAGWCWLHLASFACFSSTIRCSVSGPNFLRQNL